MSGLNLTTDGFPLSPLQEGMLFHYLNEPHAGIDIEQLVVHLAEAVDIARMQAACNWLVQRHDILRARFVWEGREQARQEILSEVHAPFTFEDAFEDARSADAPAGAQVDQIRNTRLPAFLSADRLLGFDLSAAPLLRFTLFRWDETSYSLIWTFHHALLDGRTFPILLRELFEAYAELASGTIAPRTPPPPYRRYIDWLHQELQQGSSDAAGRFWKQYLAGFTAPTRLVVDRSVPADSTDGDRNHRQGEAWETLDAELTLRLRKLAEANEITMNTVVMGAWAILLHRYSGDADVVFGATRACRKSSVQDAQETIGLFINTVPVRVKTSGDAQVLPLLKAIRKHWVEMRPHEHSPLVRVKAVSEIPPAQPLFETLLVFENYRLDSAMHSLGGAWQTRQVELHELTNFPVTLAAYDGAELSFKIEFDRRRMDEPTVQRLLGHLHRLLAGIALDPKATVDELPLLSEVERRELIEDFNTRGDLITQGPIPLDGSATLHALFEAQAARQPNAVALTCEGQSLTYAQLNAQANRLARHLGAFGVKPDTLVGLCMDRSNELVVAILAILKAGGAYLPIDLAYPADRLAFMLEDAQAPVLLTHSQLAANLPPTSAKVICVDQVLSLQSDAGQEDNLPPSSGPDHLAYVIYTSGTTGKPKGSQITHRNAARLFSATEHWYGFGPQDVWTLFHSFAFDFSVWEIWGALLYGGRVVVVPFLVSRSPEAFYELLASEKVTVLNQTPSAFRQLMQAEETVGQKALALRYVIFGGEALEMQSLRPWFERHGDRQPQLVNMYGITETTVHVTYRPLSMNDLNSGSVIGVPIPDLQIYILDSTLNPVPIGVPGEMYVGGAGLARGYLHRPELTAERFIANPFAQDPQSRLYKTGDLARFLSGDARLDIEYLGRIDDQVKIRGFRIELGEIESVLCQHPAIREASVQAREDVPGTKRLVAYLVPAATAPEVSALREHLKKKVPDYMVPAAFLFLDKLPLTASGKVDRKALPVPEFQRHDSGRRYQAPASEAEKKLAAIWGKILRVEKVGVTDNFFELGGDSILSIQVISAARREGLKLTPKLLFAHQTIAEIAAVAGIATVAEENSLSQVAINVAIEGDVPLTPIQSWFFEQDLAEPQHYNQAFLFSVAEGMNRSLLESALAEVGRHHDALRLRFVRRQDNTWRQYFAAAEELAPLTWNKLGQLEPSEQKLAVEGLAAATEASLDLQNGPLWRAAYFDLGAEQPGRLLLVVHHLAVDGVSWRPLIEDLETAYQRLRHGEKVALPPKTSAFPVWGKRLQEIAGSEALRAELPYWKSVTGPRELPPVVDSSNGTEDDTEGAARTLRVSLNAQLTQALLQQVPAVYNTQINDVLLTALGRAWSRSTSSNVLFTNLEGHGRESLAEYSNDQSESDLDISRTVGWFTSIFPVRLRLEGNDDGNAGNWQPGQALKSVKEQLRQIPRRGIGYGILRYLNAESGLAEQAEPPMVFNYLGQIDQVVADAKLLRFAPESSGPWHSPKQRRRYALEINSSVMDRQLELAWTYSPSRHSGAFIQKLADDFLTALQELIAHCQTPQAGGRTPSDFPLAKLTQNALDRLASSCGGFSKIEDIYPLSPIQALFYSANAQAIGNQLRDFDQWHCTLQGDLDVAAFQRAWQETVGRHTVLRSSIHAGDSLAEPVQIVHRNVSLPWVVEDWSRASNTSADAMWSAFLQQDRLRPISLSEAPAMRFALIRTAPHSWKFLWSVPALLLDGWSWPLVFRDASRLYGEFSAGHSAVTHRELGRPYREYVAWLGRQKQEAGHEFWKQELSGFSQPTSLPNDVLQGALANEADAAARYVNHAVEVPAEIAAALQAAARRLHVTLNTLVQGAWALVLSKQSGEEDVVLGAAFSGRPTELAGAESIVGPFVNNLPVRVAVRSEIPLSEFFKSLHARLLQLSHFQFTPLAEIQRASEVPWRYRLFDSLVVFQNYAVDESARRFGSGIQIADFAGPIHTNYSVLLLAEPDESLRLTLIYDRQNISASTIAQWGRDLVAVLERIPLFPGASEEKRVGQVLAALSPRAGHSPQPKLHVQSQNYVPPQSPLEREIAAVWQRLFGLERISIEENFFDLGGRSLLLIQLHRQLRDALKLEFSIVTLLEHPSIQALARHLSQTGQTGENAENRPSSLAMGEQLRERAQRQKQALSQMRGLRK